MVSVSTKCEDPQTKNDDTKESGYGWVIVFASFLIQFVADGVAYTFGLFYIEISKEFPEVGKSGTAWIVSILIAMTHGAGPIGSVLVNRFGCRTVSFLGSVIAALGFGLSYFAREAAVMYFTIGILGGVGFSLLYLPAIVSVPKYFTKRRSLAVGLCVCGSGVGTFFFEWALGLILSHYKWREGLLITALIILSTILPACLYAGHSIDSSNSSVPEAGVQETDNKVTTKKSPTGCLASLHKMIDLSLLTNPVFLIFSMADIFTSIGYNVPYIYLPEIEENKLKSGSSSLLGVMGVANVLSRIILGYFSDKKFVNRRYLYTACLAVAGVATIVSPHLPSLIWLRGYSAVYGICMGVYISLKSVLLVDLLGIDKLTDAFGLLLLLQAIGFFIGAPVVGFFYDHFGKYDFGFYFAGFAIFFSAVCVALIPLVRRIGQQKSASLKLIVTKSTGDLSTTNEHQV